MLVGSSCNRTFSVCNESDCALEFVLNIEQRIEGAPIDAGKSPCELSQYNIRILIQLI